MDCGGSILGKATIKDCYYDGTDKLDADVHGDTPCTSRASEARKVRRFQAPYSRSWLESLGVIKDYTTVFLGHTLSALIGFLTSVFLARMLTKGDFGAYSAFVAMAVVFSTVVDVGVTPSLVRFGSRLQSKNRHAELSGIARAAIMAKTVFGLTIGIIGFIVIYSLGFGEELNGWQVLVLVPVCGLTLSFFLMTQGILQIQREFKRVSLLLVLKGSLFLTAVVFLVMVDKLSLLTVCLLFLITTASAVTFFVKSFSGILSGKKGERSSSRRDIWSLLSFGKWIAVSGLAFSLFEQLPIAAILSGYGPEKAADFSVAIAMIGILGILSVPLMTVLMPDLSRIHSKIVLKAYWSATYRFLLPLSILVFLGALFASEFLITLFYGSEYSPSIILFQILLIPFVLAFALQPINLSVIYVFSRPKIPAITNTVQLLALLAAILLTTHSGDVIILVAIYGMIRAGGTLAVSTASIILMRSKKEFSDEIHESDPLTS